MLNLIIFKKKLVIYKLISKKLSFYHKILYTNFFFYYEDAVRVCVVMRTPSGSVYPRVLPPSRTVLASVSRCRTLPVLSVLTDRDTVRSDGRHVGHTDPDGCSCYNDKEISGRYVHTSDTQTRTAVHAQMTNGYTDDMSICRTLRSGRLFLL